MLNDESLLKKEAAVSNSNDTSTFRQELSLILPVNVSPKASFSLFFYRKQQLFPQRKNEKDFLMFFFLKCSQDIV